MDARVHAKLSPSGAHGWLNCADWRSDPSGSKFANEGTCAHAVAAACLTENLPAIAYIGRIFENVEVTNDMAEHVQTYVDLVRTYADGHTLMVEQRVPIGHITGEAGAEGTSDVVIVTADGSELIVIDLKFGRGVEVSAEASEQGQLYLLGALELVGLLGFEPSRFRFVIHQPRLRSAPSEWDCDLVTLQAFAARCRQLPTEVVPGEKQCRWCANKAGCTALERQVLGIVADDFVDVSQPIAPQLGGVLERVANSDNAHIAGLLPSLELIRDWCDAVEKRAHTELINGNPLPGYKLIAGKKGNRAWTKDSDAEAAMKAMRLRQDEMYAFKLISPTVAEKLLAKETPRRWATLARLVTQSEGKPTVAPASDPRPALQIKPADDFENVSCADLC